MQKKIKQILRALTMVSVIALCSANLFSFFDKSKPVTAVDLSLDEQEATIRAIASNEKAVVNIIVYDENEVRMMDASGNYRMVTEKEQKGRGTGFIISADGFIMTNKHVVESASKNGSYRIILNTGKQYYAQLIGKDPINDLAVLKIFEKNLSFVKLGDSNAVKIGTTVIAIGNALGLYQNSATKGIISGLGRNISANEEASGKIENLDNIMQTDAEINPGNSGGPLLDLNGKVVGINVAVDSNGSAIGFAIPINDARPVINSILKSGRIIRSRLGLRYQMLTPEIAIDHKLNRTSGAWIATSDNDAEVITKGGPAEKAGLKENDIIFEVNGIKVEGKNTLQSIIQRYKPGDKIGLKILRGNNVLVLVVELDEFKL